jgi:hypothetical protein
MATKSFGITPSALRLKDGVYLICALAELKGVNDVLKKPQAVLDTLPSLGKKNVKALGGCVTYS